ncbi:MAG: tetratricopeptide repeat protein [Myxococcales bacterium]|nr:tetratricopeptide repeat protein [Myxococcales bacterium]MCB9718276.1 tetratricopeptide repeat protein [Myxococcales bacterium]
METLPEVSALLRRGPASGPADSQQALRRELVLDRVFAPAASESARIDRYRLLRHLGEGGMGSVWVAHDERLGREVAIKLLRGSANERTAARLVREAQALAALSHPNVVQVYGTGRSDGQVYIVMELIAGQSLATWLHQPRPWPRVLEVMIQVARGLAAAHEAGIVHRDLKPSNIVIDEDGRARLIDFGIARRDEDTTGEPPPTPAGSDPLPPGTPLTRTGTVVGTPSYMAPEQLRGEASPASDQFAFCVTLYEALYGARPFGGDDYEELIVAITSGPRPPPRPEADVPPWLHRVVARGLAIDPTQRWPSMTALAERLRPPSRRARAWPLGLVAGAILAASVGGARWLAGRDEDPCDSARDELASVWTPDRRQRLHLAAGDGPEPVAGALDDWASRWHQGHTRACHEAAEIGASASGTAELACLRDAASELGARLDALEQDTDPRWAMSFDPRALPDLERCARGGTGAEPGDPRARQLLARARGLRRAEAHARAEAMASQAIERAVAAGDEEGEAMGRLLRAELWLALERFDDVEPELLAAYERARELAEPELELDAALAMVRMLTMRDRFDEASTWMRHAEAAWERGERSPGARVDLLRRRALLHRDHGELDAAYDDAREALGVATELDDPALVPSIQAELAAIARKRGELPVALDHYRRALAAEEARLGPHHGAVGHVLTNLGATLRLTGELDEARAQQERALEILLGVYGEHHTSVADVHTNLGLVAFDQRDTPRARHHFERALEILADIHGGDGAKSAVVWANLGALEYLDGRLEASMRAGKRALAGMERDLGEGHPDTAPVLGNLGVLAFERGQLGEAMGYLGRARAVLEAAQGVDPMRFAEIDTNTGLVAFERGDLDRAREALRRGREVFAREQGPSHPRVATVSFDLCLVELEQRRYAAAAAECARAREVYATQPDPVGEANLVVAEARRAIAEGRRDEGLRGFHDAIAILDAELGPEHRELYDALVHHGRALLGAGRAREAGPVLARAHGIATQEQDDRHLLESGLYRARAQWEAGEREAALESFTAAAPLVSDDESFADAAAAWRARPRSAPPLPAELEAAPP